MNTYGVHGNILNVQAQTAFDNIFGSPTLRVNFANPGVTPGGIKLNFTDPTFTGNILLNHNMAQRYLMQVPVGNDIALRYRLGYPTMTGDRLMAMQGNPMVRIMLNDGVYGNIGYLRAPFQSLAPVIQKPNFIGAVVLNNKGQIITKLKDDLSLPYKDEWKKELKDKLQTEGFGVVDDAKFNEQKVISFYHKDTKQLYKFYIIKLDSDPYTMNPEYRKYSVPDIKPLLESNSFNEILKRVFFLGYSKNLLNL